MPGRVIKDDSARRGVLISAVGDGVYVIRARQRPIRVVPSIRSAHQAWQIGDLKCESS